MKRRQFIQSSAYAAMALISCKTDHGIYPSTDTVYVFKPLRDNMGYFTEYGGTIAWLNEADSFVVVDSQFPSAAPHLIEKLKVFGNKPFKFLLNTHHHYDHTAGNISFKDLVENVVSHRNALANMKSYAKKMNTENDQFYPNLTFDNIWTQQVGREKIAGYYYGPAHTNGDVVYHFENANIIHVGDLSTKFLHPYMDRSDGSNIENWIISLEKIYKRIDKNTLVVMGHSLDPTQVIGNRDDLLSFKYYLESLLSFVKTRITNGNTKNEIIQLTTIPGLPDWKGDNLSKGLGTAYDELAN
jgi:cyclase